ncbi:MAG TPA: efflux transporter outer membrane subunit [Cytophagales bacterium]|jgi:NodT family efflux transporter outer membrane factor (OMF) lipoprotein
MKKRISLTYLALGLLLAGLPACRVGRDYARPETPLPAQFNGAATGDTVSIAAQSWQSFFPDPVLRSLVDSTLARNFDLLVARQRVEYARAASRQAGAAWLPNVFAQVNASTSTPSKNSLNGRSLETFLGTTHLEDYTASLGVSWEIDVWGKIRRQKEAALATYLQSQEAARAVQTALVAETAQGYYNLLMLDRQLAAARRNLALGDSTLQIIQLQKDAGEVTQLAVQQAEAQRQSAALLVPQLEAAITVQENGLRLLAGTLPGPVVRTTRLEDLTVPGSLPTGFPASLVSRRPDVRAAELALVAANARLGVAQASLYPALSISASRGLNAFKLSNWFSIPNSLFGAAAGSLTQPIFQRRALKTGVELARIEREQAVIRFRQSVLTAVGEVSNALVNVEKLGAGREIAAARVDTLRGAIQNARMLFNSGMANYLEVITAQSNALQSELDLADLERQRLGAVVELYRALGGGWQ